MKWHRKRGQVLRGDFVKRDGTHTTAYGTTSDHLGSMEPAVTHHAIEPPRMEPTVREEAVNNTITRRWQMHTGAAPPLTGDEVYELRNGLGQVGYVTGLPEGVRQRIYLGCDTGKGVRLNLHYGGEVSWEAWPGAPIPHPNDLVIG